MRYVGFALCVPVVLAAQEPSNEEKAMRLYEEAEAYYKLQNWSEALTRYEAAYLLSQQPELLFNIGQCYRQLGKYDQALRSYRTYLREVPDDINRAQIEQLIISTERAKEASSQPTSQPASQLATQPTSAPASLASAARPGELPTAEAPSWPRWLSASGAIGGLALGAGTLSARLRAEDAFIAGDASTFNTSARRAQVLGISADVASLAGVGLGLYSSYAAPLQNSHVLFYSLAGASAASALTFSLLGLGSARSSNETLDDTAARKLTAKSLAFGGAADSLWLSAGLWAGVGLLSQRRHHKERVSVLLTPSSAQLSANF